MNFDDLNTLPNTRASSQNSTGEQQRAALYVASQARDTADARELLDMLGLLTQPARRKQGRPEKTYEHGDEGMYRKGCRCSGCRAANTRRMQRQKEQRKANPELADRAGHGRPSTYKNYGCRCEPCTTANSAQCTAYKRARRAKARADV